MKKQTKFLTGTIPVLLMQGCGDNESSMLNGEQSPADAAGCTIGSTVAGVDLKKLCDPTKTPTYNISFRSNDPQSSPTIESLADTKIKDVILLKEVAEHMRALNVGDAQVAIGEDVVRINEKILDIETIKPDMATNMDPDKDWSFTEGSEGSEGSEGKESKEGKDGKDGKDGSEGSETSEASESGEGCDHPPCSGISLDTFKITQPGRLDPKIIDVSGFQLIDTVNGRLHR